LNKRLFSCAAIGLLMLAGCDGAFTKARKTVYAPTEEGLTLIYEDMTLPSAQRFQERLQRRISASSDTPAGRRVTITYTTFKNNFSADFVSKDGGWTLMRGDKPVATMLPEGFPDRVSHWEDPERGTTFRVVARGAIQNPNLQLPEDFDRIGIWVEMESRTGLRQRIFYLPRVGETESRILKDGVWVLNQQLVSRGFTDAPPVSDQEAKP